MNKDTVVGRVWAMHILVPDGKGGMFSEPQGRFPVFFSDLDPQVQLLIERGLQQPPHLFSSGSEEEGAESSA